MSERLRPWHADGPESRKYGGIGELARSCCVYLATITGLLCTIAKWGLAVAVTCAVLGGLSTAVVASAAWTGNRRRGTWRAIARVALTVGLGGPAAIGLVAALGFTGVMIVLILAGTTPTVTSFVRRRWFESHEECGSSKDRPIVRGPKADPLPRAAQPIPLLSSLDDAALCLAWRRSFLLLERTRSTAECLAVVEERQAYLDELYRRSPQGIAAWLAAGARASGNPLPYVGDTRPHQG